MANEWPIRCMSEIDVDSPNRLSNNIIVWESASPAVYGNCGIEHIVNEANVYWNYAYPTEIYEPARAGEAARWSEAGSNLVRADPRFVSAQTGNFEVRGSGVLSSIEFEEWDFRRAGVTSPRKLTREMPKVQTAFP
jgi:hypothetical protein